jgi:integrase
MRDITDELSTYATDDMDVADVVELIKTKLKEKESFRLDFVEYGLNIASKLKPSTAHNYRVALRSLVRFFKGRHPDISEITVRTMREFEQFIRNEPRMVYHIEKDEVVESKKKKGERAIDLYIGVVRAVYRKARMQFNEPDRGLFRIPIDTFEYYKYVRQVKIEHRDIPFEWVQMMIDQRKSLSGRERLGIDVFILSFGLMGINSIDTYLLKEKPKNDILHYFRTKTTDAKEDKAEMYVRIEPCVKEIMCDYLGKGSVFDFSERYATRLNFTVAINKGIRQWIQRNNLDKDFTFYAARHTWATIGASKEVDIDLALITEGLTHSNESRRMDAIYIRKDWERLWDANAKVLSLFKW